MHIIILLMALCLLCGIWNIVISLIIYDSLRKRGISVSFLWLRLMAPGYALKYKEITRAETGKIGLLFYQWIISINLSLVFVLITVITAI